MGPTWVLSAPDGPRNGPMNLAVRVDLSTTHRRIHPSHWLSRTSTHPTMFTQRPRSRSWMIDTHPLCSVSVGPSIPVIRIFQSLILKIQVQGHGYGQRTRWHSRPGIQLIFFHFISYQSDKQFLRYSYFRIWPWKSKVKAMGEVKGQCRIVDPVSKQCTSLSFHINRTNHS